MVTGLGPGPEFDMIRRFLRRRPGAAPAPQGVRLGPGDDCALIAGDGIAVTVDMSVEDIHYRRAWLSPEEIGWRAAAAGLSDLAAMAARPIGVLASIALPAGDAGEMGEGVSRGIAAAAEEVGAAVIGGDLVRSPGPLVVDIVALGEASAPVLRSGARAGDELWVTGYLGTAAAAVDAWLRGEEPDVTARAAFARPRPRIVQAIWLAERGVPSAMLDLSDGIAGDAGHLAAASGVRIVVEAESLPVSGAAAAREDPVRLAAAGGEDYELCFTSRPGAAGEVRRAFENRFGIPLTRVGRVVEGEGIVIVDERGGPMELKAFQHWGERA